MSLPERMKDFLQVQSAWLEGLLDELEAEIECLNGSDFSAMLEQHSGRALEIARVQREYEALKAEWRLASSVPERDRQEVGAMAARFSELCAALGALLSEAADKSVRRSEEVRASLDRLRQGRSGLRKYSVELGDDALFIDREA